MSANLTLPPLPRTLQDTELGSELMVRLLANPRALWPESHNMIPTLPMTLPLRDALRTANASQQLLRGMETANKTLADEGRGLRLIDEKKRGKRGKRSSRISRLLLLTNDGTERFYRQADTLLKYHGERLLIVQIDVDEQELGHNIFGKDAVARAVLVTRKKTVTDILSACAADMDAVPTSATVDTSAATSATDTDAIEPTPDVAKPESTSATVAPATTPTTTPTVRAAPSVAAEKPANSATASAVWANAATKRNHANE